MPPPPSFLQYAKFYWACISPFSKWVLPVHTVLGAIALIRDELLPAPWNSVHIISLLPSWSLATWVAIAAIILAVALVDGAFWDRHLSEVARSRSKPLIDVYGKPFGSPAKRGASRFIVPCVIVITFVGGYFFFPIQKPLSAIRKIGNQGSNCTTHS